MTGFDRLDRPDRLFVLTSLVIQVALTAFFAVRKWNLPVAMRVGWVVYALAVPALVVTTVLIRAHKAWYLGAAGVIFALWASFGYLVDIAYRVEWRSPIVWPIFLPYVGLYLASLMFYWWPLADVYRPAWFVYTALFIVSTLLNVTSHGWTRP